MKEKGQRAKFCPAGRLFLHYPVRATGGTTVEWRIQEQPGQRDHAQGVHGHRWPCGHRGHGQLSRAWCPVAQAAGHTEVSPLVMLCQGHWAGGHHGVQGVSPHSAGLLAVSPRFVLWLPGIRPCTMKAFCPQLLSATSAEPYRGQIVPHGDPGQVGSIRGPGPSVLGEASLQRSKAWTPHSAGSAPARPTPGHLQAARDTDGSWVRGQRAARVR